MGQLITKLEDQGWQASLTSGGHYRLAGPEGQLYFAPATPSDYRAIRNVVAELRRRGADL